MTAIPATNKTSSRELDALEFSAVVYLTLPLFVFLAGWLRPEFAAAGLTLLAWPVYSVFRSSKFDALPLTVTLVMTIALISGIWVSLSGLAGDFYLNADWNVRLSALRDLTTRQWPVSYGILDGQEKILRFPMGYYMIPAALGKLLGVDGAQAMLWVWTTLGTTLFLLLVTNSFGATRKSWLLPVALAIAFSGMDIVGWLLFRREIPGVGMHIEWWADLFQYSSNTTALFWVPNHALPAWLVSLIAWRHKDQGMELVPATLLLLTVAFWSPLVAIGALPLVAWSVLRGETVYRFVANSATIPFWMLLPLGAFVMYFVMFGTSPQTAGITVDPISIPLLTYLETYTIFVVLEWGLLAALIFSAKEQSPIFWIAAAELAVLPLIRFGPGNDIVMRGGIPALTIIMLTLTKSLSASNIPRDIRIPIMTLLALGMITPALEIQRAFRTPPQYKFDTRSFIDQHGSPWHYIGNLTGHPIQYILRETTSSTPNSYGIFHR